MSNEAPPTVQTPSEISVLVPRQDSPVARSGVLERRKRRRKLDLRTLNGTLRESGRVYRDLCEGRISMAEAEVRSRVLRRHGEILGAVEQAAQVEEIRQRLEQIQSPPALGYSNSQEQAP